MGIQLKKADGTAISPLVNSSDITWNGNIDLGNNAIYGAKTWGYETNPVTMIGDESSSTNKIICITPELRVTDAGDNGTTIACDTLQCTNIKPWGASMGTTPFALKSHRHNAFDIDAQNLYSFVGIRGSDDIYDEPFVYSRDGWNVRSVPSPRESTGSIEWGECKFCLIPLGFGSALFSASAIMNGAGVDNSTIDVTATFEYEVYNSNGNSDSLYTHVFGFPSTSDKDSLQSHFADVTYTEGFAYKQRFKIILNPTGCYEGSVNVGARFDVLLLGSSLFESM